MKRRDRKTSRANHERWLVSYADFITLLFAFFVVLYSSSQVDKQKMNQLSSAIEGAFTQLGAFQDHSRVSLLPAAIAQHPSDLSVAAKQSTPDAPAATPRVDIESLRRALEQALAPEITRHEVALRVGPEGLVVSLREVGFFNSGSARLRPQAEPAFSRIARLLRDRDCDIRIEGHTDDVPIHTAVFKSNWELSTARATEIIRLLIVRYGFDPFRLSAAGYGEFHPAAPNSTDEGRRTNRRIDLVVLEHSVSALRPADN